MAKPGIRKITASVMPREIIARNKENPFSAMDSCQRQEHLKQDAARVWVDICRRQAEESAERVKPLHDSDA